MVTTTESPPTTDPPSHGGMLHSRGFPRRDQSVGECRAWFASILAGLQLADPYTASLVVSELATNSLRHTKPHAVYTVGFEARCYEPRDGLVRLEIRDWDETKPVVREVDEEDTGGRGLALVAAFTFCWGVAPESEGKVVYAYLSLGEATA